MDPQILEALQKPFAGEDIKQREGRGRLTFSYVPIGDVIRRVLVETKGNYWWEIVSLSYQPLRGSLEFMWVCHGRLTIRSEDGYEYFDGIGTHPAMDEESPKAAESDAFKRAAVKAGVALHLYDEPSGNGKAPNPAPREAGGGISNKWLGPGNAPCCGAAVNFPHKPGCQGE